MVDMLNNINRLLTSGSNGIAGSELRRTQLNKSNPYERVPNSDTVVLSQTTNELSDDIKQNSVEKIQNEIKANGGISSIVSKEILNAKQKNIIDHFVSVYNVEPIVIRDDATDEIHVFFNVLNSETGVNIGQQSVEIVFNESENSMVTNRYYTNGKIAQDVEKGNGADSGSYLIQAPNKSNSTTDNPIINEALDIDIDIDPKYLGGMSASQKKDFEEYVQALKELKPKLMKDLKLDNDTYNKLAKMSIAIAIQEVGLERGLNWKRMFKKTLVGQFGADCLRIGAIVSNKLLNTRLTTATSKGLSNVKVGDWDDNARIDRLFKEYGVTRGYFTELTGKQSAAVTMIVLSDLARQVKSKSIPKGRHYSLAEGAEAATDRYYIAYRIRENGECIDVPKGVIRYNNVTLEDRIAYLYNGREATLRKGNLTPEENIYSHNIRRYMSGVTITEDPIQRENALKNAGGIS